MQIAYIGVVEDRNDPVELGRIRVRFFGIHTEDKVKLPTESLPWAIPLIPNSASISGIGDTPTGYVEGSWVIGMFMDGERKQEPIILGALNTVSSPVDATVGFSDPNGVYPKYTGKDTNKKALGEDDSRIEVDTSIAGFDKSPYDAKYPYNHVKETQSGHFKEYDDTEGAERIREQHKTGTYYEIDSNGNRTDYIAKGHYSVVSTDSELHVKGNVKIIVDGNADIQVSEKTTLTCPDNVIDGELKVTGNVRVERGITTGKDVVTDKGISLNDHKHKIISGSSAGVTDKPQK